MELCIHHEFRPSYMKYNAKKMLSGGAENDGHEND